MNNQKRGEVEVRDRDGNAHAFKLGSGAICKIEEDLNLDIMDIFDSLKQGRMRVTTVRAFVVAARVTPDGKATTKEEAEQIIDGVGVLPLLDVMTDSITATFGTGTNANPQSTGTNANPQSTGTNANPQKGAARKGKRKVAGADSSNEPQQKAS